MRENLFKNIKYRKVIMKQDLIERFIRYVKIDTQSDDASLTVPSTLKQLELSKLLLQELQELNIDSFLDEYGLVYGTLKGEKDSKTIGLIAHVDTALECKGGNFTPRVIENYDGKDIVLNDEVTIKVDNNPHLLSKKGHTLLVTDGYHLLGGDDKAGVAIIMQTLKYFSTHPEIKHKNIQVCFTVDEEIGRGADHFSLDKFKADYAYTVDGGDINYLSYENFNAASSKVIIKGVSTHPGDGKDKMVNASLLGNEFNSHLLTLEKITPRESEGREGFIHLDYIHGDVSSCELDYIIRDFDSKKLEDKKRAFLETQKYLEKKYPTSVIEVEILDQYKNMGELISIDDSCIQDIIKAYQKENINIEFEPIRGGTDGARITFMGLKCPNLGTGDYSCHSLKEHVDVNDMERMVKVLINLLSL